MKKILLLCSIQLTGLFLLAQENEVKLADMKVPVAPAFSILDYAPKTIENPGTIKAFSANLATLAGQSGGIPRNFAFEFSPYWFFKHPSMNMYKYYGYKTTDQGFTSKPNIFYGLRSASISFGSVFKDSSSTMPVDVNYIGYAVRANVINVRHSRVFRLFKESIENVNESLGDALAAAQLKCATLADTLRIKCIGEAIATTKDSTFRANRETFTKFLNARPLFSADLALASSTAFGNNSFSNSRRYRSGGWLTLAFYKPLVSSQKIKEDIDNFLSCKNYLNAFLLFRYLSENKTDDFKTFAKQNLVDIGGRLEFEFDRFSISLESVKRFNNDKTVKNTSRTVGIAQYKINNDLFLVGTFGKDFGEIKNVISLLGLNWGFGEKGINKPFNTP